MRITIRFNLSIAIDIDFGFETPLFSSMYWFHIQKVYFDTDGTVEYAEMLFNLIKHPKYWNSRLKKVGFIKLSEQEIANSHIVYDEDAIEEYYEERNEAERNSRSDEANQY